jgi:orotate phosphoribosyltransferase
MGNQIEGYYEAGQKVVVIEDLISTGGSSLKAVEALREAKLDVRGLVAIFTYGFDIAHENFANAECPYVTLSDYHTLVKIAAQNGWINESDIASLNDWRNAPSEWKK